MMDNPSQDLGDDDGDADENFGYKVPHFEMPMEESFRKFDKNVEHSHVDFKASVMNFVTTTKLNDTYLLNNKVEELKKAEGLELEKLNIERMKLDKKLKKVEEKDKKFQGILGEEIQKWAIRRKKKIVFQHYMQTFYAASKITKWEEYVEKFHKVGLKRKLIKALKLDSRIAGNRNFQKKLTEKTIIEVDAQVEEKSNQLTFLEEMIKELEEKYRIELRKKTILKTQCD